MKLSNTVGVIRNDQILIATASVESQNKKLIPGVMVKGKIICEPLTLFEYIYKAINIVIN